MSQNNEQKIYLIYADKRTVKQFFSTVTPSEIDFWVYFGKKVTNFSEIEKIVCGGIKKYDIADKLEKNAQQSRQEYIDYIGNCAVEIDSSLWYLTSISEKNPNLSDFYLNFCYMKTFFQIILNDKGNCTVFCESRSLIKSLKSNLGNKPGFEIKCYGLDSSKLRELFIYNIHTVKNKIGFIYHIFPRILIAKYVKLMRTNENNTLREQPVVVIRSWVDKRSFSVSDFYNDVYFGNLNKKIEHYNQNYFYLLDILATMPYQLAVKKICSGNFHWHLYEEFLDFSDIFRALYAGSQSRGIRVKNTILSGLDISDLIDDEYSSDNINIRAESCFLNYLGAKKMFRLFNVPRFIYTFENHIWEKMLVNGIREVSKTTTIIGYAHATVTAMEMFYSVSAKEKNLIPLPDIILVNGVRAKKVLEESGFQDRDIQIIGSLRYGNLVDIDRCKRSDDRKKILVVLSVDFDRSVEMISKCVKAFGELDDMHILFKPHPTINHERFIEYEDGLSKIFSFTSEPIKSILSFIDLVIYSDSTVAVEAAASGIPILQIKSDFTIDVNIFENSKLIPSIRSPEQIRTHALEILSDTNPKSIELQKVAREIIAPVDDEVIQKIFTMCS